MVSEFCAHEHEINKMAKRTTHQRKISSTKININLSKRQAQWGRLFYEAQIMLPPSPLNPRVICHLRYIHYFQPSNPSEIIHLKKWCETKIMEMAARLST